MIEIPIPQSHGLKQIRHREAHDLVGQPLKPPAAIRSGDRSSNDDPGRPAFAQRAHRGLHRRAGRDPVVDDDDGLATNRQPRAIAVVDVVAPFQLDALARGDLFDHIGRDAEGGDRLVAQHSHAPCGDGADRKFGMPGGAELPDEEHIERRTECVGDFERDRHASARQGQDDEVIAVLVVVERLGEAAAGVASIGKEGSRQCFCRISRAGRC